MTEPIKTAGRRPSDRLGVVSQGREPGAPLPPGLELVQREADGVLVVEAVGDVDQETAPALGAAIISGIDAAGGGPCILDLAAVTFLDSAGLTVLLEATLHAEAQREPLPIVVDSNRPVIRPIQVTGLDNELSLYHTVEEALNATKS